MDIRTHGKINQTLCGKPVFTENGNSQVELKTTPEMAADEKGLVHGGFVFGLADYAAMIAVNHPNVVLGGSEAKFLKPVTVGDTVIADASVETDSGKRKIVSVTARVKDTPVFQGIFACFTLEKHVLD